MKRAILPLMLSAVIAPASHAAIYLNNGAITDFDISHSGGNVYITTSGGSQTGGEDPAPTPVEPTPEPVEPPPPVDNGSCSAESQELVFETIDWVNQGGRVTLKTNSRTISSRFTTTSSSAYNGQILGVQTTGTGGTTRRFWISTCPDGAPVEPACESIGVDNKITWNQGSPTKYCDLNRNTTYYINYRNLDGRGDTYRALRNNGKP